MRGGSLNQVLQSVSKSPVIATFVGGLLLNLFGYIKNVDDQKQVKYQAQNEKKRKEKKRAHSQALLEKRIALLSSFGQDIERVTSIDGSFYKSRLWLKSHREEGAQNDVGMSRPQILSLYTDLWKLLMDTKQERAILAEVQCFFKVQELPALIKEAERTLEVTHDANTEEERKARERDHEKVLDKVMEVMANAIQEDQKKIEE